MINNKLSKSLQAIIGSSEEEQVTPPEVEEVKDDFFDEDAPAEMDELGEGDEEEAEEISPEEVSDAMEEVNSSGEASDDENADDADEEEIKIEEIDPEEVQVNETMNEEPEEITEDEVEKAKKDSDDYSESKPEEITEDEIKSATEDMKEDEEDMKEDEEDMKEDEEDMKEDEEDMKEDEEDMKEDEEDIVEVNDIEEVSDDDSEKDDSGSEEITEDEVEEAAATLGEDEGLKELGDESISADDDSTSTALELLSNNGYSASIDEEGHIVVTGSGEPSNVEVVEDIPSDLTVAPSDVNLVLHESASEDPFYTVLIKGKPAASIHLEDQDDAENKKDFFISPEYPRTLTDAMVKAGVIPVLDAQKAKRFVASVETSALAKKMKSEAKAEMQKDVQKAVIAAKDKFIESVKLAIAGMNKNFFKNDNNLKASCYAAFSGLGLDEDEAQEKTEAIFSNSDDFFSSVVAKAQELMTYDETAFKTVASAVSEAGVGVRAVTTFEQKLTQGNSPIIAGAMAQKVAASKETVPAKKLVFKKY